MCPSDLQSKTRRSELLGAAHIPVFPTAANALSRLGRRGQRNRLDVGHPIDHLLDTVIKRLRPTVTFKQDFKEFDSVVEKFINGLKPR